MPIIRNLTPRPVTIFAEDGQTILHTFPVDGPAPRVVERVIPARPLELRPRAELHPKDVGRLPVVGPGLGIPTAMVGYEDRIVDLPDPEPGVILVVSRMVAEAADGRADLFFPHDLVRDENGRVLGCRALGYPEGADD